jgi:hypothetical protein
MIEHISENWGFYLEALFAFLGFCSVVARKTPNQNDNKAIDWALKRINNLGLRGGPTD